MSDLHALKPNVLVLLPDGTESLGTIPEMPQFNLPGGEVYLRVGEHRGPNRGFGVRHIWEAHRLELEKLGCTSIEGIAQFLAEMVTPGAEIYCEFKAQRGGERVAVLKSARGTLILEPRHERRGFGYYVVTWYSQRRAHGTLVGKVRRPPKPE